MKSRSTRGRESLDAVDGFADALLRPAIFFRSTSAKVSSFSVVRNVRAFKSLLSDLRPI
jgi:hypothetical protein